MGRKAVLFVNGSKECDSARKILQEAGIDFVECDVREHDESGCCGEPSAMEVPSIFAPEGVFKGLSGVKRYVDAKKMEQKLESESAYW